MYKVLNCGTRLEIYTDKKNLSAVVDLAKSFGIEAQQIGYVEAAETNEVILKTEKGEFQYS
jgi:phosphoribosylformylglycinamidine cyclo-ligase